MIQDAVVRNLQVLAESTKRIDPQCRDRFPEIPWRQIAGLRNVVVHDYFDVDWNDIWEIVSIDLAQLKDQFLRLRDEVKRPSE